MAGLQGDEHDDYSEAEEESVYSEEELSGSELLRQLDTFVEAGALSTTASLPGSFELVETVSHDPNPNYPSGSTYEICELSRGFTYEI